MSDYMVLFREVMQILTINDYFQALFYLKSEVKAKCLCRTILSAKIQPRLTVVEIIIQHCFSQSSPF